MCNVHIHWDPEYSDVKMMQTQFLLEQARALTNTWKEKYSQPVCFCLFLFLLSSLLFLFSPFSLFQEGEDFPLIICGDFNSTPSSGVYELLQHGGVPGEHPEFFDYDYGEVFFPLVFCFVLFCFVLFFSFSPSFLFPSPPLPKPNQNISTRKRGFHILSVRSGVVMDSQGKNPSSQITLLILLVVLIISG